MWDTPTGELHLVARAQSVTLVDNPDGQQAAVRIGLRAYTLRDETAPEPVTETFHFPHGRSAGRSASAHP